MLKPLSHVPLQPLEEILDRSCITPTATKQARQNQALKYTFTPWMLEACRKAAWTFNKLYTVTNQIYGSNRDKAKLIEEKALAKWSAQKLQELVFPHCDWGHLGLCPEQAHCP